MTFIIALDPGQTTGFAVFVNDGEYVGSGTIGDSIWGFINDWRSVITASWRPDVVVSERYLPDGSVRGEDGVHSPRIEGYLIGQSQERHFDLIWQSRSDKASLIKGSEKTRNAWIDERFPGVTTQHARDAITHFVVYAKRNPEKYHRVLKEWFQ